MVAARKKQDEHLRYIEKHGTYPPEVLMQPCQSCGASPGKWCQVRFAGKGIAAAEPHESRIALAELGRGW